MHPHRLIGPIDATIVNLVGRLTPLHPNPPARGSVIIVSVIPTEFTMALDTRRRGPVVEDFLGIGLPEGATPEKAYMVRGMVSYRLPAAPANGQGPEGWAALEVYPSTQLMENVTLEDGANGFVPMACTARETAEALIANWSTFPMENLKSVGLEIVDHPDQITPEFISALQQRTRRQLEDIVQGVDNFLRIPGTTRQPQASHVRAVHYLGLERPWAPGSRPTKNCPACGNGIAVNATVCQHCRTDLRTFWQQSIASGFQTIEDLEKIDSVLAAQVRGSLQISKPARVKAAKTTEQSEPAAPPAQPMQTTDDQLTAEQLRQRLAQI